MAIIYKPKTFIQIYDAMKRWLIGASSKLNNFNIGARLSVLLEAIASMIGETNNDYYQALKKAIPTSVYNAFDFEKKAGVQSSGKLEFTRGVAATKDYIVPVGTAIMLNGIKFATIVVGEISTGNISTGQLESQCEEIGKDGNIAMNAIDTLIGQGSFINQPDGVEACKNPVSFSGGTEEETDDERIERFRIYIQSLSKSTVQGLISGTLNVDGIISASIVEHYPSPGWNTIYADDGTGALSAIMKAEIEKVINGDSADYENYPGYRAAGIQVQVLPPDVQSIDFTFDLKILNTSLADPTDLISNAQNALETYVNTLELGMDVILTEAIKLMKNSNSEIYDISFTAPIGNTIITANKLARTGVITPTYSIVGI